MDGHPSLSYLIRHARGGAITEQGKGFQFLPEVGVEEKRKT